MDSSAHLPVGSTEIYLHPATRDDFAGGAPGYRYADELAALIDTDIATLARRPGVVLGGYSDFDQRAVDRFRYPALRTRLLRRRYLADTAAIGNLVRGALWRH